MACDVIFKIGNQELSFSTQLEEGNFLTKDSINLVINDLLDSDKLNELQSKISLSLQSDSISKVSYRGPVVPNTTVQELRSKLSIDSKIDFGEKDNDDIPILLTTNLSKDKESYYGKRIKLNDGRYEYIVYNDKASISRFANFLKLNDKIKELRDTSSVLYKTSKEFSELLMNDLKGKIEDLPSTFADFLENYINNIDKYKELLDNSIILKINTYITNILSGKLNATFKGTILDILLSNMRYDYYSSSYQLSLSFIKKTLTDFKVEDINNFKDAAKYFSKLLADTDYYIIDPYKQKQSGFIQLKSRETLQSKLGIPVINDLYAIQPIEKIGNYYLYKYKDQYFALKHRISYFTKPPTEFFESEEKAVEWMKNMTKKIQDLQNSDLSFLLKDNDSNISPIGYTSGRVLEILDVKPGIYKPREILVKYGIYSINQFIESLSSYDNKTLSRINQTLNSSEKVNLFLSIVGEQIFSSPTQDIVKLINDTLETIEQAENKPRKYYIVYDSKKLKENQYQLKGEFFKIDDTIEGINHKYDSPQPIVMELFALQKLFKNNGIQVELITNNIAQALKLPDNAKAFIKDGIIYLNINKASKSDLYHEYTHLMLGILKNKNMEMYNALMEAFKNNLSDENLNEIKNKYKEFNLSEIDLIEEAFAERFGKYLQYDTTDRFKIFESEYWIFDEVKKLVEDNQGSIFGENVKIDLSNKSINDILSIFSKQIIKAKDSLGLVFSEEGEASKKSIKKFIDNLDDNKDNVIYKDCK